jgi:hypothetical protein
MPFRSTLGREGICRLQSLLLSYGAVPVKSAALKEAVM